MTLNKKEKHKNVLIRIWKVCLDETKTLIKLFASYVIDVFMLTKNEEETTMETKTNSIPVITIRNNENGNEFSAKSTIEPDKERAGVYLDTPEINTIGLHVLQKKYPEVVNVATFQILLMEQLGLSPVCFGTVKPWKTEEERKNVSVLVDGKEFDKPKPEPVIEVKTNADADEVNILAVLKMIEQHGVEHVNVFQSKAIEKFGEAKGRELTVLALEKFNQKPSNKTIF